MHVAPKSGREMKTCFSSVGLVSVQPGYVPDGMHSTVTKCKGQEHAERAELVPQLCKNKSVQSMCGSAPLICTCGLKAKMIIDVRE